MDLLRDEILEGAVVERDGRFSLAMEKAREKLQRFQLPDPHFYITQLMQAFIAAGARTIEVTHEREHATELGLSGYKLTISFDGPGYTGAELEQLYDHLFISGRDRSKDRIRELALGIVSCQALGPHEIRIRSNGHEWRFPPGQASKPAPANRAERGNSLFVSGPGEGSEVKLLASHCRHCDAAITLNDTRIAAPSKQFTGVSPWPNYHFSGKLARGAMGLAYGEMDKTRLTVLRYGVQVAHRWEDRIYPPVSMIIEADSLRKNASQTDVVEDHAYFDVVTELQHALLDLSIHLASQRIPAYNREQVFGFLLDFFDQWMTPHAVSGPRHDLPEGMRRLIGLKLFSDIYGQRFSIEQVSDSYQRDGYLSLAHRRHPYLKTRDWLVICPSEREAKTLKRLFPRVRYVDDELKRWARSRAPARRPEAPEVVTRNGMKFLSTATATEAGLGYFVGIPDAYPSERSTIIFKHGLTWKEVTTDLNGWSLFCQVDGPAGDRDEAAVVRGARLVMEAQAANLYEHLSARLAAVDRQPRDPATIFHAREHLSAYWITLLQATLNERYVQEPVERQQLCNKALGEHAWSSRTLATRTGSGVSLADVSTWLGTFESVVLVFGGPAYPEDHGLDAGPLTAELLALVFGKQKVVEASFQDARMLERKQQEKLAGASTGPPLVKTEHKTEAQEQAELEALRQEFAEARDGLHPTAGEAGTRDGQPPPPENPDDEDIDEDEPDADAEPPPAPEPETTRAVSARRRDLQLLERMPALAGGSFRTAEATGRLIIAADGSRGLSIYRGEELLEQRVASVAPLRGWVDVADPGRIDQVLHREGARVLNELAERLLRFPTDGSSFLNGCRRLLAYLDSSPGQVRAMLDEPPPYPALCQLYFLPGANHTTTSLWNLKQVVERFGVLKVVRSEETDPGVDYPVAVVDQTVSQRVYREIFGVELDFLEEQVGQTDREALIAAVRSELWRIASNPELRLTPELLGGVDWGEPTRFYQLWGRYFVRHSADTGATELNPAHAVVKKVLRSFREDTSMVPVLASSIYTAINRALAQVEDHHELAFLESLLNTHREA